MNHERHNNSFNPTPCQHCFQDSFSVVARMPAHGASLFGRQTPFKSSDIISDERVVYDEQMKITGRAGVAVVNVRRYNRSERC